MKKTLHYALGMILIAVLSACGSAPEPTLTADDIANTAIAGAWLVVTQTHAALPTPTATLTPAPSPVLPTLTPPPALPIFTSTVTSAPATLTMIAGAATCNDPPPYQPRGALVDVQFINESRGLVSLSFGLLDPNTLGECGTYNFSFGRYESRIEKVLAGCYWAYAFVTGDTPSTAQNINNLCVTDASRIWDIRIGTEVIGF